MFKKYSIALIALVILPASAMADLSRLQSLLNATPEGGWVRANTTTYSSAWATGLDAVNYPSYQNPATVVSAWSSFAWDSTRHDLLLWGGGHANYAGNEMYVWDGGTGAWSRGSVSSRLDTSNYVVDNAAPQSSHTYDNNVYLPVNDVFLTFGGAAFQSGSHFSSANGREGPWLWNPAKADPNKVGGTDGSGYDPQSEGGEMWVNRQGQWSGTEVPGYVNGTTAYRSENSRDIVYLTADSQASGWQSLYRYTLGDVKNGGTDAWEIAGVSGNSTNGQAGAGTIDSAHNLYVRTASGGTFGDLMVWNLNQSNPGSNFNIKVDLQLADGTPFEINPGYGVEYDAANGKVLLWDGFGSVWSVTVAVDAAGNVLPNWLVTELSSVTTEHPNSGPGTGVLGKWKYVSELGAFVALEQYSNVSGDAGVWLYKPFATAVPETSTYLMMLAGLCLMNWVAHRKSIVV